MCRSPRTTEQSTFKNIGENRLNNFCPCVSQTLSIIEMQMNLRCQGLGRQGPSFFLSTVRTCHLSFPTFGPKDPTCLSPLILHFCPVLDNDTDFCWSRLSVSLIRTSVEVSFRRFEGVSSLKILDLDWTFPDFSQTKTQKKEFRVLRLLECKNNGKVQLTTDDIESLKLSENFKPGFIT